MKKPGQILIIIALIGLLSACDDGQHKTLLFPKVSQNAQDYIAKTQQSSSVLPAYQQIAMTHYLQQYYYPWRHDVDFTHYKLPKSQLNIKALQMAVLRNYEHHTYFGENYHKLPQQWSHHLAVQMDLATFPNRNQAAITLKNIEVRVLPSPVPAYENPKLAGQGYPFDTLQMSTLWAGTPVHILQTTRNGKWDLVYAPFVYGWIPSTAIAEVNAAFMQQWQSKHYIVPLKDHLAIKDIAGHFHFDARIGGLYPLAKVEKNRYEILIPIANAQQQASIVKAYLTKTNSAIMPYAGTKTHIAQVINALQGKAYGWGGLYLLRDCSATMRDLFTTFGIWLPRNSGTQLAGGHSLVIASLSKADKLKIITKNAIPFATLIGYPGHVTLYLGQQQHQPIVFQNVWGYPTFNLFGHEGRAIVGGSVISSMTLQSHHFGLRTKTLLDEPLIMTNLAPSLTDQAAMVTAFNAFDKTKATSTAINDAKA